VTVDHEDLRSDCGLYAVGALRGSDRTRLEEHLRTCDECRASVRDFGIVAGSLPYAVPLVDPPRDLRERVVAAASRARSPRLRAPAALLGEPIQHRSRRDLMLLGAWAAAAASLLVAVAVSVRAANLQNRLRDTEQRLSEAVARLTDSDQRLQASLREITTVRQRLTVLTAGDTVELRLAGQAPARAASARAFLSRSRGVLFTATNLPAIAPDQTYQVWYLTRGAPLSAGLIKPEADGSAVATFNVPSTTALVGIAVSLEPAGGVPSPTGAIYLATQ